MKDALPDIRSITDREISFYESYHLAFSGLSDERYGRIVRAMCEFQFNATLPKFDNEEDKRIWKLVCLSLKLG